METDEKIAQIELKSVWDAMHDMNIRAHQWMTHDGIGLCVNFIQVNTTAIMTLSVMNKRERQLALSRSRFASLMHQMESWMLECREQNESDCKAELYDWSYSNAAECSGYLWGRYLGCHRVFLFPLSHVSEVCSSLFTVQHLDILRDYCGIQSVCVETRTDKTHSRTLFWGTMQDD